MHGCTRIEAFNRGAGLATDKWFQVINNIMLFKTVSYTTKKLKNKFK